MNKLSALITELCPNGVEYKELQAVLKIKNGSDYKSFGEGDIPVYGSGGIIAHTNRFAYDKPSVLIPRKGSVDKLYYVDVPFWNVDTIFYTEINTGLVIPRYVYHCLLREHLEKLNTAGGVPSLTQNVLNKVKIPVPPIEVQREIVRILDTFTELTSELTENLSKELTARKHQYTYYRNKLLEKNTKAMKMKLGDIFDFQNGFAFKSRLFKESGNAILRIVNIKANQISTDNLVFFDEADYKENLSPYIVRQNDIVIAMSGATTGKIGVNVTPFNFYLNQRVGKFIPKENIVLSRYLYHLLLQMSEEIHAISEGGAQPNLSSEKLKKLTAYIPPISEQKRIVKVLDTFAYLCTDLTSGLPAEIEARQKQYEYYRDKLLSFTPAD